MLILALDSAGEGCGVCVWRDGIILAESCEAMGRGQDQRLMPMVVETMARAGVDFDALDRIAVTRGPGSFTGLRIGLAAARGIGLATDKPVIGIDRFALYRAMVPTPESGLLVVLESKRKELYCRFYPLKGQPTEPSMMTNDEITAFLADNPKVMVVGDTPLSSLQETEADPKTPSESALCAALAALVDADDPVFRPTPLYIRAPDVTVARK